MVPLQHPWGRAPSLGPCLWQRSAAGCPKTPILGPTRPLSPKVSLKNEFSLVPTYPAGYPHGPSTTPMGSRPVAWPLSLATKRCRMPKNTYSGSHPATFAQGLPKKTSFPWVPTRRVEYPHGLSIIPMGSHPYAWPRS